MYSVEVAGYPAEVKGEGKPRRSVLSPEKLVDSYPSAKGTHQITTLYENFLEGVQRAGTLMMNNVRDRRQERSHNGQ